MKAFLDLFLEEGFFVIKDVLSAQQCSSLLREIVREMSGSRRDYVHEGDYRVHCPLQMKMPMKEAVRACVKLGYETLDPFLQRRKFLVELSSITVFPGAIGQRVHSDDNEPGKFVVTVFVNLAPTERGVGALQIIPGSHLKQVPSKVPQILELPAGAAVFANSKLKHSGTENRSVDRIRPVFYCSFGDDDIMGHTYSIRQEYRRRFLLSDFKKKLVDENSRPKLRIGHWASLEIGTSSVPNLIVMSGNEVLTVINPEEPWIVDLVAALGTSSSIAVGDLSRQIGIEVDRLIPVLEKFEDTGFVVW